MMKDAHILSAFDRDLEAIQALIMRMGGMVEVAILDSARALATRDLELAEKVRAGIPLRDFAMPEDAAGAAVLLCSTAGRYITGVTLRVDGGMGIA